jgi:hypothetical protein
MMRKRKREKGNGNGRVPACPHCGAGADGATIGIYWSYDERCWRCIICGYRGYENVLRPKRRADIVAERIWDEILDALDQEERNPIGKRYP